MPGWIVQWYANEPAEGKVIVKVPPGAIAPESHAALLAVEVWVVLSRFVHVTLPPAALVIGFGL
jgi:hypothetical protein